MTPTSRRATPMTIRLSGFPTSVRRVLLQHYRIDDTCSNAYTAWKAMGSPQQPTTEQYAQLQSVAGLQLTLPFFLSALRSPAFVSTKTVQ
ncbi:GH39 family glycosyl hydrolase [Edaphobacter aggregans]|uniref:GH39 family glycosyl hydrolase n=1 Tax=Edaphobacter aggregans TaxID=570835 RepID=UPI00068D92B1|nr:hypothetical protein [Edaphobacter aggregans]